MSMPEVAAWETEPVAVTIDQFDAIRDMSFWLAPDGVPVNASSVEASVLQVPNHVRDGEGPIVRDVSVNWAGSNRGEALAIAIAVGGLSKSGTVSKYRFVARDGKVEQALFEQQIDTSDGSRYTINRPLESRDVPRLVWNLIEFSEGTSEPSPW